MQIFVPKETYAGESRVPVIPQIAKKLTEIGADVVVESGLGASIYFSDDDYEKAGVSISTDRDGSLGAADIVLRLRKPPAEEIARLKSGAIHVSLLDPFNSPELVTGLAQHNVSAIAMEMIPRTTLAQKMDALSSQANLAGYVAVILAAERLNKILPMMMTPAGTITPARVFIIGVGVAGLQAIATARRLGARVDAFDTRPAVEEQVQSLGAKFVKVDLGQTGETEQGYARELTPEQQEMQREAMAKVCAQADIVITTAQLFGKPAPRIVTRDMIAGMKPGSVIVDLAVETGGNVEGSEIDHEVDIDGVRVVGLANLPGHVAAVASQMYASNLGSLLEHFWDKEANRMTINLDDEIMKGCLVTHQGAIRHETIRDRVHSAQASE